MPFTTVDRLRSLSLAAMVDTVIELQNHPEAAEMPHAETPCTYISA